MRRKIYIDIYENTITVNQFTYSSKIYEIPFNTNYHTQKINVIRAIGLCINTK